MKSILLFALLSVLPFTSAKASYSEPGIYIETEGHAFVIRLYCADAECNTIGMQRSWNTEIKTYPALTIRQWESRIAEGDAKRHYLFNEESIFKTVRWEDGLGIFNLIVPIFWVIGPVIMTGHDLIEASPIFDRRVKIAKHDFLAMARSLGKSNSASETLRVRVTRKSFDALLDIFDIE